MEAGAHSLKVSIGLALLVLSGCQTKPDGLQSFQLETSFGLMTIRTLPQNEAVNQALAAAFADGCPEGIRLAEIAQDHCIGLDIVCQDSVFQNITPNPTLRHLRGAVFLLPGAAAHRFYLVQGRPLTPTALDVYAEEKKLKYTAAERERYLKYGGAPQLDGIGIPVGVVTDGLEVIDKLAALPTDAKKQPLKPILLKYKAARAQ
jgi:hypothetical protein